MIKARGEDFSSMQFTCFVVLFQDFEILHDQERVHRWISRSIRDYRRIRSLVMIHVQTSATSFFTHFFRNFEILHDQERVHRWISRSIRDYRRIRSLVMIHVQTSATSFFTHFFRNYDIHRNCIEHILQGIHIFSGTTIHQNCIGFEIP